jgi:hypothetical protein
MAVAQEDPHHQERYHQFETRLRELLLPFARRIEYGNLRSQPSEWQTAEGGKITNVAIVYETPGGSTDQINVSYDHLRGCFTLLDESLGEVETDSVDTVLDNVRPRIAGIPEKRREHLRSEVRREIDAGMSRMALVGHLNRLLTSEFRGGTITHLELRDAMTFAVSYSKGQPPSPK